MNRYLEKTGKRSHAQTRILTHQCCPLKSFFSVQRLTQNLIVPTLSEQNSNWGIRYIISANIIMVNANLSVFMLLSVCVLTQHGTRSHNLLLYSSSVYYILGSRAFLITSRDSQLKRGIYRYASQDARNAFGTSTVWQSYNVVINLT